MYYSLNHINGLVEVIIHSDEFARLEDNGMKEAVEEFWEEDDGLFKDEEYLVNQYNRNRAPKDWISEVDEIDQNNQPFGD